MARPTELSLERVAAAAEELLAKGSEPTVNALRAALGGSDSTTSRFLRTWKEQRMASNVASAPVLIPADVNAVLRGWVEGQLAQSRERHEAVLAVEKDCRASAASLAEQHAVELKTVLQRLADSEATLRHRHEQVIAVQSELTVTMSQLADCERQKAEITQQLEQARREGAEAQTRAVLAEQRSTLMEQFRPRARARAGADSGRGGSSS